MTETLPNLPAPSGWLLRSARSTHRSAVRFFHSPFFLALAWTLGVLVGLSIPGESMPAPELLTHDKFLHFGCFFGIAVLWIRTYPAQWRRVVVLVLLAAWLTEPYQGWLPWADRQPDPIDAVANTLGLLAGTALAWQRYVRPASKRTDPASERANVEAGSVRERPGR